MELFGNVSEKSKKHFWNLVKTLFKDTFQVFLKLTEDTF